MTLPTTPNSGWTPSAASRPELVLPAYDSSTLADLMPSIGAHQRVPGCDHDALRLPEADRYVVVLIDGLGWHLVRRSIRRAPYLASLLGDAAAITAGVPSTTVTSLTSLGTGLPPGQHGMVGYTSRVPSTGEILNALTWESDLVARAFQTKPTLFERARDAGVAVSSVGLERFKDSGLTEAALRGAEFVGFQSEQAEDLRIDLVVDAAQRGERSLVYAYERELDHCGHVQGSESVTWLEHLTRIDAMCERLRDALPDDVTMIVTGDHGMVDISPDHHLIAEDHPELMAGVSALAGEGRFRHLYVDHDRPTRVAQRWRERLGEQAWIRTRDEAIDEGWFGPVDDSLRERYGHVLVAMRDQSAVMTRQFPRELSLVGMHGSLTPAEMMVPLFID
jgi:predicted AlkP superfamily pyrophosphatase or phosphodiesterase